MAISLNDNIKIEVNKPPDDRYLKPDGTRYTDAQDVLTTIIPSRRFIDMIVSTDEGFMIFDGATTDDALVPYSVGGNSEIDDAIVSSNKAWSSFKINTELENKVNKEAGKGLSEENYTTADKDRLANTSGVNTGDQDISGISTNAQAISDLIQNKVDKIVGKGLSERDFTEALFNKLQALESSRFVGQYLSLSALTTAHPNADIGNYAYVDNGVGEPTQKYIWDSSDNEWIIATGSSTEETPASILFKFLENADTNVLTDAYKTMLDNLSTNLASKLDKGTYTGNAEDIINLINSIDESKFIDNGDGTVSPKSGNKLRAADINDLPLSYYSSSDFDADFEQRTTDNLNEGLLNLYATGDEFQLSTDTLDDVLEGNANKHFTSEKETKLNGIEAEAQKNVQSDYNQTIETADDYIKNMPKPKFLTVPVSNELEADNVMGNYYNLTAPTNQFSFTLVNKKAGAFIVVRVNADTLGTPESVQIDGTTTGRKSGTLQWEDNTDMNLKIFVRDDLSIEWEYFKTNY